MRVRGKRHGQINFFVLLWWLFPAPALPKVRPFFQTLHLFTCALFFPFTRYILSGTAFICWSFSQIVSNAQKPPRRTSPARFEVHAWVRGSKSGFELHTQSGKNDDWNVSEIVSDCVFLKTPLGETWPPVSLPDLYVGTLVTFSGFLLLLLLLLLLLGLMPSLLWGWKTLWGSLNAIRYPLYEWSVENVSTSRRLHGSRRRRVAHWNPTVDEHISFKSTLSSHSFARWRDSAQPG